MMFSITDRSERIVIFAILGLAAALRVAPCAMDSSGRNMKISQH